MNKIACIDIGSNSVRMVILNDEDMWIEQRKYVQTTRLGRDVDKYKVLSSERMEHTILAIKDFYRIAKNKGVDKVCAIATAAVRISENRDEFVKKIERIGIDIEVIDGKKEAKLGFIGVMGGLDIDDNKNALVIDVGGYSTELILGNKKNVIALNSLNIGVIKLLEKFVTKNPISKEEVENIKAYVNCEAKEFLNHINKFDIDTVVGIGGTASTIASMDLMLDKYDRKKVHNHIIKIEDILSMQENIINETVEERIKRPGLMRKRADIIPVGYIILTEILKLLNKDKIIVSEYDNLEGLFLEKLYLR